MFNRRHALMLALLFPCAGAWSDHMPPISLSEVAAGITDAGGPDVSSVLRMETPADPKVHGREFYFATNGSGTPVKWGSPSAKFIIRINISYDTKGTWSADISSTYISTGQILNAAGSTSAVYPPKDSDKEPHPPPRSARGAVALAYTIFNRGRRDGKVLLRGGHTATR